MDSISINYYYELKAKELATQLESAKLFFKNHKPSYGFSGETILREFLSSNMPCRVKVTQGFVQNEKQDISPQCDIIIYDSHKYAPIAKFGEIEVIPSLAVLSTIEVKTSVNKNTFQIALKNNFLLNELGVNNNYLFFFNSVYPKTMENFFYTKKKDSKLIYDHGCYLPNGIVSLDKNYYYQFGYVHQSTNGIPEDIAIKYEVEGRDKMGYVAWQLTYTNEELNKYSYVSALQLFLSDLYSCIGLSDQEYLYDFDSVVDMSNKHQFGLWDC
jgi:hypothetical protein